MASLLTRFDFVSTCEIHRESARKGRLNYGMAAVLTVPMVALPGCHGLENVVQVRVCVLPEEKAAELIAPLANSCHRNTRRNNRGRLIAFAPTQPSCAATSLRRELSCGCHPLHHCDLNYCLPRIACAD